MSDFEKIIIIGIDGADWNYILRYDLPNLQRIALTGMIGDLKSTFPPITPIAWTSMFTGVNPGKHGLFGFGKAKETGTINKRMSYDYTLCTRKDVKFPAIWDRYDSDAMYFHVPMTYPPKPIKDGHMVSSFLTPKPEQAFTDPQLKADLDDVAGEGGYEIGTTKRTVEDRMRLLDKRWRCIQHLMGKYNHLPLQVYVVTNLDGICHFNPSDKDMEPAYRRCDEEVGRILDNAQDDELYIFVSDHGHFQFTNILSMNTLLAQGKYLQFHRGTRLIDWDNTMIYYPIFHGTESGDLRINLRGREEKGCVRPEEVKLLKRMVSRFLMDSGYVDWITEPQHIYSGPEVENAPDLLFRVRDDIKLATGNTPSTITKMQTASKHRDFGIFGLWNSGRKTIQPKFIGTRAIEDIAATIYAVRGDTQYLENLDGKPIISKSE